MHGRAVLLQVRKSLAIVEHSEGSIEQHPSCSEMFTQLDIVALLCVSLGNSTRLRHQSGILTQGYVQLA
jgi:hypothetical protein